MNYRRKRYWSLLRAGLVGALLATASAIALPIERLPEPLRRVLMPVLLLPMRLVDLVWGSGDTVSPWFVVAIVGRFWAGVGAAAAMTLVHWWQRRVAVRSEPGQHCRSCGYCLRGLTSARCPECGHPTER